MRKIKYLLLLVTLTFTLTGCVKFNADMEIKKDKSMDFSIIYAFDTSVFGNQEILENDDKAKLKKQGFTVTDYTKGSMKGVKLTRTVKNIDLISTETSTKYNLSGILENNSSDNYVFEVKKGFLKNTYTAKLNFDASDSDLSDSQADSSYDTDSDDSSVDSDFDLSGITSNAISNMDLSFNVTLPYSAISNNATSTNNDNKNLSWNLSSNEANTMEFEFELYNMTNVYIGIGVIVLLVVIIIFLFINKHKKKNIVKPSGPTNQEVQNDVQDVQPTVESLMSNTEQNVQPTVTSTSVEQPTPTTEQSTEISNNETNSKSDEEIL